MEDNLEWCWHGGDMPASQPSAPYPVKGGGKVGQVGGSIVGL